MTRPSCPHLDQQPTQEVMDQDTETRPSLLSRISKPDRLAVESKTPIKSPPILSKEDIDITSFREGRISESRAVVLMIYFVEAKRRKSSKTYNQHKLQCDITTKGYAAHHNIYSLTIQVSSNCRERKRAVLRSRM
jgi:hypothetical protein